jgi:hypothetical protein
MSLSPVTTIPAKLFFGLAPSELRALGKTLPGPDLGITELRALAAQVSSDSEAFGYIDRRYALLTGESLPAGAPPAVASAAAEIVDPIGDAPPASDTQAPDAEALQVGGAAPAASVEGEPAVSRSFSGSYPPAPPGWRVPALPAGTRTGATPRIVKTLDREEAPFDPFAPVVDEAQLFKKMYSNSKLERTRAMAFFQRGAHGSDSAYRFKMYLQPRSERERGTGRIDFDNRSTTHYVQYVSGLRGPRWEHISGERTSSDLVGATVRRVGTMAEGELWEVSGPDSWVGQEGKHPLWEAPLQVFLRPDRVYVKAPGGPVERYAPPVDATLDSPNPIDSLYQLIQLHREHLTEWEPGGTVIDRDNTESHINPPALPEALTVQDLLEREEAKQPDKVWVTFDDGPQPVRYIISADMEGVRFRRADARSDGVTFTELGEAHEAVLVRSSAPPLLVDLVDDSVNRRSIRYLIHGGEVIKTGNEHPNLVPENADLIANYIHNRDRLWAEAQKLRPEGGPQ